MPNFQNKGISTSVGILIILLVAIVLGGGIWWWQQKNLPVSNLAFNQNQNQTANWQTYSNEEYGFKIKYPGNWEYREKKYSDEVKDITGLIATTGFTPKDKVCNLAGDRVYPIEIVINLKSLQQFFTEEDENLRKTTEQCKETRIGTGTDEKYCEETEKFLKLRNKETLVNGIPAVEVKGLQEETLKFVIDRPGKNSHFSIDNLIPIMMSNECISLSEKTELLVIFNQILSTFKFLQ